MMEKRRAGIRCGIPSYCTANELALEIALRRAKLIEREEKPAASYDTPLDDAGHSRRTNLVGMLVAVAVLIAVCVVLLLVLKQML
jgi:hypothetical protein